MKNPPRVFTIAIPVPIPVLPALNGYQWKSLFIPDGTILRTVFKGQNHHAAVQGDHILFNDKPVSPGEFANALGCGARNAWHTVWLRFPHDPEWRLAADCRDSAGTRARHSTAADAQKGDVK